MIADLVSSFGRSVGLSAVMRVAGLVTRLVPIAQPTLMVGPSSSARLGQAIASFAHHKILVVTDHQITRLGLHHELTQALTDGGTAWLIFNEIEQDAPIALIDKGVRIFQDQSCDAIVAIGGGSVLDAAKAIGLCVTNHKSPQLLVGYIKGLHAPVPLYAVPTTAGTGSEVSVVAVVSDPDKHRKLVITDPRLVPRMAALDPCLMTGLPAAITATTGMDALTHAIEAYLGHWSTPYTDRMALAAVGLIYDNLRTVFKNGNDLAAREKMALASTYAGLAFTRASVGYVHAIAHQLGGLYQTPHGLANAILLPHILRFYAESVERKLAALALQVNLGVQGEPENELAKKFLASVEALCSDLAIPQQLNALRRPDIANLAKAACHEANMNYPVPRYMSVASCEQVIRRILPKREARKRVSRAMVLPG